MADKASATDARVRGNDIILTRIFDAPRALVYDVWTKPEHLKHWWGPKNFTLPGCTMDLRSGGTYRFVMRGPDGNDYPFHGVYKEVKPPELLSFSAVIETDTSLEVMTVVTFEEVGKKTRVTVTQNIIGGIPDDALQGWSQSYERLAEYVENIHEPVRDNEILSTRVFDAPRAKLWTAWSTPEHLARWWGPDGFTNTFHTFDFVPGGKWEFVMHGPDGRNYDNQSVFREIVPQERIVFDHDCPPHFRARFDFVDQGGKTRLVFRMTFESADMCNALKGIVVPSNEQNFDRLEAELKRME